METSKLVVLQRIAVVVAGLAGASLLIYAGKVALSAWMWSELCDYRPRLERFSPDGGMKAAVVDYDCGAASSFRSMVVIGPIVRPFDYRRDVVANFRGTVRDVEWRGRRLIVSRGIAAPLGAAHSFEGVSVEYVPVVD